MFPVLAFLTPLLFGAAASGQGVATNATCSAASLQWAFNSRLQSPCVVAAYLGGVCDNGLFTVPALGPSQEYLGPTVAQANQCICSSVMYSVLSACAGCQGRNVLTWSIFSQNCTTTYISRFPEAIPSNTAVPHWAYQNVTIFDGFNATAAQTQLNAPESTAGGQATSTSIPSGLPSSHPIEPVSGGKKANAGAIAGGVVGGVVGAALIFVVAFLLIRRRKHSDPPSRLVTSAPVSMSDAGDHITPFTGGLPAAKLYNPDDPSTFPSSIGSTTYHQGRVRSPALSGHTVTGSAQYSGAPEV
ncbi:unnamed protein product [Mycena citricolor]|uniref:Uncharacterized protein n=1 Tax=Mycena citricolor TaxID=2018698 RepID=A0AAD2JZ07_9AGAR|nr:unnamed protein product [Mycena citricolor]